MRILVVGGGGREHALCWRLRRDRPAAQLFAAPGNAGIEALADLVPLQADDLEGIATWCREARPDLVVIGPDEPLARGIVDALTAQGTLVFGPTAAAARIESSKAWAADVLAEADVPRPEAWVFDSPDAADTFVRAHPGPLVVKADGLARGKGVIVCDTPAEAHDAIDEVGRRRAFGAAGERFVLQERLNGPELSVFALCDGEVAHIIGTARDHKRLGEGDRGPNTGGMGAYSPVAEADPAMLAGIESAILAPTLRELRRRGAPFTGFLYAGLMLTPDGPRVLEFNSRLGDPEAQVILPLLRFDLAAAMLAAAGGRLATFETSEPQGAAVCVVLASGGYPGPHQSGMEIKGLGALEPDVLAIHAATTRVGDRLLTAGGRVLGITGLGATVTEARARAYAGIAMVRFDGAVWRRDIAADHA
ncbi:phosphoribosylamine--glycine ligase [soil metagenome]